MRWVAIAAIFASTVSGGPVPKKVDNLLNKLPIYFEPNQGQASKNVRYISRAPGMTLALMDDGAAIRTKSGVVRMRILGGSAKGAFEPLELQGGRSSYFRGSNMVEWQTDVQHYGKVRAKQVYPGVDLVYYGQGRTLEYDFIVKPGADWKRARVRWEGVKSMQIDQQGDLVLATADGDVRMHKPRAFQGTTEIAAAYKLEKNGVVGFDIGEYDTKQELVIDPVVTYATYLGGASNDFPLASVADADGNYYVAGQTFSTDFPVQGAAQGTLGGASDVFVTKFNANGTGLVFSTFIGGSGNDAANGVAIDSARNVYLTGRTASANFPLLNPIQNTIGSAQDAFVTKLNAAGNALVYSTFLGGSDSDEAKDIAVDATNAAYVTGFTSSANFPTTAGAFRTTSGGSTEVFVTKINAAGSARVYSTFAGGSGTDFARGIALDGAMNAYVAGNTTSSNFPVTANAVQTTKRGTGDAFLFKLNPAGSGVTYSTYYGCATFTAEDFGAFTSFLSVTVDEAGRAYAAGNTTCSDFPTTVNGFQRTKGGTGPFAQDAVVVKLNSMGSAAIFSTYLGGSAEESATDIAVNENGNAFVTGSTNSMNFANGQLIPAPPGNNTSAYVVGFNPLGSGLSYPAGVGNETSGTTVAVDPVGNVYVAGNTISTTFPVTPGAFDITKAGLAGVADGVAAKISDMQLPLCRGALSSTSVTHTSNVSGGTPALTTNCNWHAIPSVPFVTLNGANTGTNNGVVNYTVAANATAQPRSGSITAADSIFQIMQSPANPTAPYTDVPVNNGFVNFITRMKTLAITSGCDANNYCPDGNTTRGQMAVFIIRALHGGDNFPFEAVPFFDDVPANHPFFKWIQKMREYGITSGCTGTSYCPDSNVTRGQMAVFIVRALVGNNFRFSATPYFDDAAANHPFFKFIQKMKEWGITAGCTATSYCPDSNTTRGQMGVFIVRGFDTAR